jgi:DNA-binding transcriptional LysR family regulator
MVMELRHIRYFLAVAEERHFTRAAARVGIGQPPLSQQIKDLEVEIGAALFRRVAHGAELTPAGLAFLDRVKGMPALAEQGKQAARRASRGELGSLRIGFTASSAFNAVVPTAIRSFRRAYGDVELALEESNTTRLVTGLEEASLDAAFLHLADAGIEALQLRLLAEEPMVVALPASHPAAARQAVDLAVLKLDPFLLFPRSIGPMLYDIIIGACRMAGFDPLIGQLVPQLSSVIALVAADIGVSIVPVSMSQLQVTGVAYRAIAGEATPIAPLALATRRGDTSRVVQNFVAQALS